MCNTIKVYMQTLIDYMEIRTKTALSFTFCKLYRFIDTFFNVAIFCIMNVYSTAEISIPTCVCLTAIYIEKRTVFQQGFYTALCKILGFSGDMDVPAAKYQHKALAVELKHGPKCCFLNHTQ